MKKRLFSLFLALVMVLGMLPATALAAGDPVAKIGETTYTKLQDAIDAADPGATITLVADVNENVTVTKNLTIDGADKNYTGKMTLNKVTVTIENVNFVKGQVYKHKSTGAAGTYTIKNCDFDGQGLNDYAVNLGGTGSIVIENVTAKDYGYGLLQVPASNNSVSIKDVEISNAGYAIKVDYSNGVSLENVVIKDSTYGFVNSNFGAKTITVKECSFGADYPVVIWDRNTTKVNTFKFEGENDFGSNAFYYQTVTEAEMAYTKYVLTEGATLTAVEGLAVTTDVEDGKVVYENGVYKIKMPPEIPEGLAKATEVEGDHGLTFALNFQFDEEVLAELSEEEFNALVEAYANYFVDFELTFNKDVTLDANGTGDGYLAGQYDDWSENWVNVPFNGAVTLAAGEPIMIMDYAAKTIGQWGLRLRLYEIYEVVQNFDCGVYLTPEYIAANPDLEVTLKLNLYKPAFQYDGNSDPDVCPYGKDIELGSYTFPEAKYTVSMNGNGGKLPSGYEVFQIKNLSIYGDVELSNPGYTKLGYELTGWKTGKNITFGTGVVSVEELAAADKNQSDKTIYITAQWSPKDYTINMNGGSGKLDNGYKVYQFTANYEGTATLIDPGYTYLGYKLAGWEVGGTVYPVGSEVPVSELLALDKNKNDEVIYLSAVWEPGDYILNFNGGAGTNDGKKVLQVKYVKSTDKVVLGDIDGNFTREGYTLVGWDSGSTGHEYDLTTEYVVLDLLKNDKNPYDNTIYLSAMWDVNQYTITFDTDGGSAVAPITQDYGTEIVKPADPTKTGYTFAGWDVEIPATMPAEDMTITAQWTINQYTITFDTDGGSEIAPIVQDYGTAITAPADPTKEGYTFAGWDVAIPATMPAEDVTITAQWTVNQYTITFDTDGGSEIAPITQDYGTAITAPADPTKTGYTFTGWEPALPATMPAEDMTINAQWEANEYTVTLDPDGGTVDPAEVTVTYNSAYGELPVPTKLGYEFTGWADESGAVVTAETVYTVADDTTLTAQWKKTIFNITVEATEGGTVEVAETAAMREYVKLAITPETGWKVVKAELKYIGSNGTPVTTQLLKDDGSIAKGFMMPAADVTVVVEFEKVLYSITFEEYTGGKVVATVNGEEVTSAYYGDEVVFVVTPDIGWKLTSMHYNYTGVVNGGGNAATELKIDMPAGDVVLRPVFEKIEYTITVVPSDYGTVVAKVNGEEATSAYYGDEVVFEVTPNEGYKLVELNYYFALDNGSGAGGSLAADAALSLSMRNGDLKVTPVFEACQYTVTLDPNGGKVDPTTVTVTYNEKVGELPVPTLTKATFLGWFDAEGNEVTAETVYTVAGDSTYTAKWLMHPVYANVTKELFTIQCTEVEEHSWLCHMFGSHVTLVKDSVKWNEETGRWEAQLKVGSSMFNNINSTQPRNNYFGGFTHHYDVSTYYIDVYFDAEFTGTNSLSKEVTGMWLPVKEYVFDVYCYTEPAMPNLAKITTTAIKVLDADAAYKGTSYQGKYTVKQLIDGTYTLGEMYTENGKFYVDLTVTDLAPYINALSAKNGKNYVLPEWEKHHTAEDFKYTLVYTGSTTDYKQDGTGWSVDASSWVNNTEKLNGKYLWVTEQFTVKYTDGVDGEEVFADEIYTVNAFSENGGTKNTVADFSATATPAFAGSTDREGYMFKGWSPEVAATVTADATYTATYKRDVANAVITLDPASCVYSGGAECKPAVTVAFADGETVPADDYTVEFENNVNVGTATVTVTVKSESENFYGVITKTFEITAKPITDTDVTVTVEYTETVYSGSEKKPAVTVVWGEKTLVEGTEYTVAYSGDLVNVGTATVTVTGIGNYKGEVVKTFEITAKPITDEGVNVSVEYDEIVYDATAKEPAVTIKWGEKTLVQGTDYTVAYTNNTNAGTATVTVTGIGNYKGEVVKTFEITPKPITDEDVDVSIEYTEVVYDGTAKEPAVTVKWGEKVLVEGTDYEVTYTNNVSGDKGVATVTVKGIGNFGESVEKTFEFLYTVTFVTEGITTPEKQYVKYGKTATDPGASVKFGYDFAGWYTEAKTKYDFSTPVTMPITLTAQFVFGQIGGLITPPANTPVVTVNGLNTVDHMAYIIGSGDGKVNPLGTITRAEVATIFFRLMEDDFRAKYWDNQSSYADVAAGAWYNVAVATLENAGIIKDTVTGGNFRPTDLITRAELAVMAAQFAQVSGEVPATTFADVPATYWAAAEIAVVQYAGWIEGNNGMYRPDANLTRAECMTIVNRMLQRGAEAENMLADMTTFTDNVYGTWYYEAVQEATNSHTYDRTEAVLTGESFLGEKWVKMEAAPDWAALEKAWAEA